MCIIFFVANGNPVPDSYKLILASNRDEFYSRPALAAAAWLENPFVFGGRDLEKGREGGTWLAVGAKGGVIKVGALLNITGESRRPNAGGRGPIVSNYVSGHLNSDEYAKELIKNDDNYNPFNMISIEIDNKHAKILHISNAPTGVVSQPQSEILGFGNSPVTTPLQKVVNGKKKFQKVLDTFQDSKDLLVENLMNFLQDREKHWPDDELKRRAPNWGENLSSICVKMPEAGYGSRTRTVILIDWQNRMDFYEETMATSDPNGQWKNTHIFRQL